MPVYDTAGPYGDPQVKLDVRVGLARLREQWVAERGDTEAVTHLSSDFTRDRLADNGLDHLRYPNRPAPLKAKTGKCVTQLHYARKGL